MKKKVNEVAVPLTAQEAKRVFGGYFPPTKEQIEQLEKRLGKLGAQFVCW